MKKAKCPHLRKQLFCKITRTGTARVVEQCLDCGVNTRSSVPRRELQVPLEDLPLLPSDTPATDAPRQADLFEDAS